MAKKKATAKRTMRTTQRRANDSKEDAMHTSNLLTVEEVKNRLGTTERTIRRYIAGGLLKVRRFGPLVKLKQKDGTFKAMPKNVRVDELDLEMFIRTGGLGASSAA